MKALGERALVLRAAPAERLRHGVRPLRSLHTAGGDAQIEAGPVTAAEERGEVRRRETEV